MFDNSMKAITITIGLTLSSMVSAEQFVVELAEPMADNDAELNKNLNVSEVERFDAEGKSFIVLDAKDLTTLQTYFTAKAISPLKVKEVGFVNSPEIGGGAKTGADILPGHQTYVIERPIPGIGSFPLATQKQLSKGSNAVLSKMGADIEWVHSYLTDEGTYCVYRAVDSSKIVEHGKLAEFPIDTITPVVHTKASSN